MLNMKKDSSQKEQKQNIDFPQENELEQIASKTAITIQLEDSLLKLIANYQVDSLEPIRTSAIKSLIRFALKEKGYLKNF